MSRREVLGTGFYFNKLEFECEDNFILTILIQVNLSQLIRQWYVITALGRVFSLDKCEMVLYQ